jgi:hypothetical protein
LKHPRTHRYFNRPDLPPKDHRAPPPLEYRIPPGQPQSPERIDAAVADALRGWAVVRLRVVGDLRSKIAFGNNPGPRLHGLICGAVDRALCTCGSSCVNRACPAHQLLGRHEVGPGSGIGDPWAPVALRVSRATHGRAITGTTTRIELVLAGRAAVNAAEFVRALGNDRDGEVDWRTIQYLQGGAEGEPRWRAAKTVASEDMLLPLDVVGEPRLRSRRLTWMFHSPTTLNRLGEFGSPHVAFPLILDRAGRGLATWMHRTGHRGPHLPSHDLLRAAARVETAADHTRVIGLATHTVGAGDEGPDSIGALMGSVTWKGDFTPFARLLRAIHYVGMGPARAHGFGEVELA